MARLIASARRVGLLSFASAKAKLVLRKYSRPRRAPLSGDVGGLDAVGAFQLNTGHAHKAEQAPPGLLEA